MTMNLGDEPLTGLLEAAGSSYNVSQITQLVRGVAAAPPALDARAWLELVRPAPDDALDAALLALKATIEAESDFGLEAFRPPITRLNALRAELQRRRIDGFMIPRADEHQGEYVPPCAMRLAWLTGFTGSAGAAVVLKDKAAIFVDGRYTLQVEVETDISAFEPRHLIDTPLATWLAKEVSEGDVIGYDPWLHTPRGVRKLERALKKVGASLVALDQNAVDAVWGEQPPPPISPVRIQSMEFAGQASLEKRAEVAQELQKDGIYAAVLTLPDSIAWLLNIRGADIPRTPFPLSFAIIDQVGQVELFIDPRKLSAAADAHLHDVMIQVPDAFGQSLKALGQGGRRVLVDPSSVPQWVVNQLDGATIVERMDPCALPKARKNATELEGARQAHLRDGAAVTRFLAWLEAQVANGSTTEMEAANRLETCRRAAPELRDLSFDTISGAGPNGAVVHYRVSESTNRRLELGSLYLVDSGGQYPDGTTDITRTVAIGSATSEMKDRFTRVLKGHIALAKVRFPKGTTGAHLDVLARYPLWQVGLDYDHGTGHGVGSYLSVHEGPQRISKSPNTTALEAGMILSNEPGYYKTGEFGIRIENLVAVRACADLEEADRDMLEFETLTMAPIDRNLVDVALLDEGELAWLNAYHLRVRENLAHRLEGSEREYLMRATALIERSAG